MAMPCFYRKTEPFTATYRIGTIINASPFSINANPIVDGTICIRNQDSTTHLYDRAVVIIVSQLGISDFAVQLLIADFDPTVVVAMKLRPEF